MRRRSARGAVSADEEQRRVALRTKLAADWHQETIGSRCAVCGEGRLQALEGHHVIPRMKLRQVAHERGWSWDDLQHILWDTRNHLCVCTRCHARHERATERIPLAVLDARHLEFADAVGLSVVLERMYHVESDPPSS